jgi:hypothetical protein
MGTPAVAAMMPGCTQLTVTSMKTRARSRIVEEGGVGVDSHRQLRARVTRMVAKTGADEILHDEPWRVTASGAGADENKSDAVYCAAAVGNRIVAEYKGLSFPVDVCTPLCVLAEAVVTLDVSAAAQPCAVRWLGGVVQAELV